MHCILLIHSSISASFGCFHFSIDGIVLITGVQITLQDPASISVGYLFRIAFPHLFIYFGSTRFQTQGLTQASRHSTSEFYSQPSF